MTQEVQPLTWSKRTNIEEHQQFFSKINEIIGNLAPTVDEAEQAIAQATAAIASANDAVAMAALASVIACVAWAMAASASFTVGARLPMISFILEKNCWCSSIFVLFCQVSGCTSCVILSPDIL